MQSSRVYYGNYATYNGDESEIKKYIGDEPSKYYEFASWTPSLSEPIKGITDYYADFVFDGYIEDDWETIIENINSGEDVYGYGGKKKMDFTFTNQGVTYNQELELEIVDKNHDLLTNIDPEYNLGKETAHITFRGKLENFNRTAA